MKKTASIFLIATIGGIMALGINQWIQRPNISEHTQLTYGQPMNVVKTSSFNIPENGIDFTIAAEMSVHAVVNVKTSYGQKNNQYYYDPFRDLFGQQFQERQSPAQTGSGSGVIISKDGYIVTNHHVIENADKIEVTLNDKRSYSAKVIGTDPATDLALLKIEENNLPFINYGNSDEVKVGEWVLAVGNPFNLTSTVTAGIVSAKARNINILENNPAKGINAVESFIQTDAAVNPGNSGGALVNTKGELIGINSAIASNTGSYTGYSFAIPVNITRKVVADLLEFGEVQRAFIGVSIRDLDAKLAQEKNIGEIKGVYVQGLTNGGAGEEAGMKEGDIITNVGNIAVNNVPELQEQISRYRPGDKISVTLKRNEQEKIITMVLKNRNGNIDLVKKQPSEIISALGATFEALNNNELKKLSIQNGLKIKKLEAGKLLSAGIKEGFIVTSIDKKIINTLEDLRTALQNKKGGVLIEGVYPNGMRAYYGFGL